MLPTWQARLENLLRRVGGIEEALEGIHELHERVSALEDLIQRAARRSALSPDIPRSVLEADAEASRRRSSSHNAIRGFHSHFPRP